MFVMPFPQKQVIIPMAHVRNLYSGNFLLAKTARIWDNSVAANFLVEHTIPLEKGAEYQTALQLHFTFSCFPSR